MEYDLSIEINEKMIRVWGQHLKKPLKLWLSVRLTLKVLFSNISLSATAYSQKYFRLIIAYSFSLTQFFVQYTVE